MKQPWASVDRWGPLAVSLLTFLAFIGYAWTHGERTAALEGRVAAVNDELRRASERETAMLVKNDTLQAYIAALRGDMIRSGLKPAPTPVDP